MTQEPIEKHVIFLGAGASYTSGYPIGQELRLRMCSRSHLDEELRKIFPDPPRTDMFEKRRTAMKACRGLFEHFRDSIELFREGGFATVDEFSKLASERYSNHVQNMKRLMRLALGLQNPEDTFESSDYYPFIQHLFDDELFSLKKNMTVLTFNYDCYLDFLLLRAFEKRQGLSENGSKLDDRLSNKLTSGFYKRTSDFKWAEQRLGFNYFKLHGSIAYGGESEPYSYAYLFKKNNAEDRLQYFSNPFFTQYPPPPIVFPWELFDTKGEFQKEDDFIFVKHATETESGEFGNSREYGRLLFKHFQAIWEGARRAIELADKISFVGLSMHPYLEQGFTYLLKEIEKPVQIVVANPENEAFRDAKTEFHPLSLCGKLASLLRRISLCRGYSRDFQFTKSSSEEDGMVNPRKGV